MEEGEGGGRRKRNLKAWRAREDTDQFKVSPLPFLPTLALGFRGVHIPSSLPLFSEGFGEP